MAKSETSCARMLKDVSLPRGSCSKGEADISLAPHSTLRSDAKGQTASQQLSSRQDKQASGFLPLKQPSDSHALSLRTHVPFSKVHLNTHSTALPPSCSILPHSVQCQSYDAASLLFASHRHGERRQRLKDNSNHMARTIAASLWSLALHCFTGRLPALHCKAVWTAFVLEEALTAVSQLHTALCCFDKGLKRQKQNTTTAWLFLTRRCGATDQNTSGAPLPRTVHKEPLFKSTFAFSHPQRSQSPHQPHLQSLCPPQTA